MEEIFKNINYRILELFMNYSNEKFMIREIARKLKCKNLTCQVDVGAYGSEIAFKAILAFGFKVYEARENKIQFYKEL